MCKPSADGETHYHVNGHAHSHGNDHLPHTHENGHGQGEEGRGARVRIERDVLDKNDRLADYNRGRLAGRRVLLNKIDLPPHVPFNLDRFLEGVRAVNPALRVIQISAYRGDGLEEWHNWIREQIATRRPVTI